MPLPDERPRQSVANLIGRFETHIQRQPSSTNTSSRSASVTSQNTNDSTKEEVKEKREWPPRSLQSTSNPPPIVPSSSWTRSQQALEAAGAREQPVATPPEPVEEPSVTPRPASTTSLPDPSKVAAAQQQLSIGVNTKIAAATSTPTPTPTTARPAKTPIGKTSAASSASKPASRVGPRPSMPSMSHVVQPLRPQHTGPASMSSPSMRRSVVKPPPGTPSAKQPARTPATAPRPKTPASAAAATSRPKTPSTGLFAPTAASLARSRSAQPQSPTPPKKAVLSSAAAERLSKPTAASLSKARTPVVGASPLKQSVSRPTAKGAVKPGTTPAASRAKKDVPSAFKAPKGPAAAAAAAPATKDHQTAGEPEHPATDDAPPPQEVNNTPPSEIFTHTTNDAADEPAHVEAEVVLEDQPHDDEVVDHAQESSHDTTSESVEVTTPVDDQAPPNVQVGGATDDIEAMVNLLESVSISKPRPQSIVTIPDEEI